VRTVAALVCLALLCIWAMELPAQDPGRSDPLVRGLDHVPIAVADLAAAAERYRALGFTLKPGRPHDNGIANWHAKFGDGSELELITAPRAVDALTRQYRDHLRYGDGPAFLALYTTNATDVAALAETLGLMPRRSGPLVTFREESPLAHLFFGPRNASSSDRPEHFQHANGARRLLAVWLAGLPTEAERELLTGLGARLGPARFEVPEDVAGQRARLSEGELRFLPMGEALVEGRRIVGATLEVANLTPIRRLLATGRQNLGLSFVETGDRLLVSPDSAHGLWLEFVSAR